MSRFVSNYSPLGGIGKASGSFFRRSGRVSPIAKDLLPMTFFALLMAFLLPTAFGQVERQSVVGGGILTGKILNPDATEGEDYVIALPGGGEISLSANRIRKKEILRQETIDYRLNAPLKPDTVESHAELAALCDDLGLLSEAKSHRERIIALDPENESARRALGYEKKDGVWMTPKQRREQAGLVTYGGRAVTPQEEALLRQKDENKKAAAVWKRRLKSIQTRLHGPDAEEARNELWSISDPNALKSVTDALRKEKEDPQIRILYVKAMGKIGTPAALGDLASVALVDEDGDVRLTALETIAEHPKAIPGAIQFFRKSLHRPENYMINRAGFALGFFNAFDAVDDLVNALVTTHKETIVIPGSQTSATFSSDGSFTFNPGNSDQTKTVTQTLENPDVLDALRRIVQNSYPNPADFGFDVGAWKDWLIEQRNLTDYNPRRDP